MNKKLFGGKIELRQLVLLGMLLAIQIILSRFCSIATPIAKIGFAFLPLAAAAYLFGPVPTAILAVAADFLGATLFPIGAYFPGFTLTAMVNGALYGIFLYKKPFRVWKAAAAAVVTGLICTVGMNTLWIHMLYGKAVTVLLPVRLLQSAVTIPVEIILVSLLCRILAGSKGWSLAGNMDRKE